MSTNTVTYLNDGGPSAAPLDLLAQSFADMSLENIKDRYSSPDARDTLDLGATSTIKWSVVGSQFIDVRTAMVEFQFDIIQPSGASAAVLAPLPIAAALDNVVFRAGNVDLYRSNTKAPLLGQLLYNLSSSQDYVVSVQRAGGVLLDSGRGAYNVTGTNTSYGVRRQIPIGPATVPTLFYRCPLLELVPVLRDLAGKPLQGDFQLELTRAADNNNLLYYADASTKTAGVTIRPASGMSCSRPAAPRWSPSYDSASSRVAERTESSRVYPCNTRHRELTATGINTRHRELTATGIDRIESSHRELTATGIDTSGPG